MRRETGPELGPLGRIPFLGDPVEDIDRMVIAVDHRLDRQSGRRVVFQGVFVVKTVDHAARVVADKRPELRLIGQVVIDVPGGKAGGEVAAELVPELVPAPYHAQVVVGLFFGASQTLIGHDGGQVAIGMGKPGVDRKVIVPPGIVVQVQHPAVFLVVGVGLLDHLEGRDGPVEILEVVLGHIVHVAQTRLEFSRIAPDRKEGLVSPVTAGRLHERGVDLLPPPRPGGKAHLPAQSPAAVLQRTSPVVQFRLIDEPHGDQGKIHLPQHRVVDVHPVP